MLGRAGRALLPFGHWRGRVLVRSDPVGLRRPLHHHVRAGLRAHPLDHVGRTLPGQDQGRRQRTRVRRKLHPGVPRDQDVPELARHARLGAHFLDVLWNLRGRHRLRLLRRARDQGQNARRNSAGTRQINQQKMKLLKK